MEQEGVEFSAQCVSVHSVWECVCVCVCVCVW